MKKRLLAMIICLAFFCSVKNVYANVPFVIGGDPVVHSTDFRITGFEKDLSFSSSIAELLDGALMVATSQTRGVLFVTESGTLRYRKDDNIDGIADVNSVLNAGIPGTVTSVVFGDLTDKDLDYYHFVESLAPSVGQLDKKFSTGDYSCIADLSKIGGLYINGVGQGVVYQLTIQQLSDHYVVSEPSTMLLFGSGLFVAFVRRRNWP